MFELCPLCLSGGPRSDRHGVIERHPTLALSGPFLDPGDIASHGAVEEYGPQIPTLGQRRTEVQRPRPAEQTGPLRRQAVAYAASGSGKVAQAEANRQAIVRRPSRLRLRRLIQSRGGLCPRLEGRSAARTEEQRPWRLRSAGVFAWRSLPVRLVRRLGDHQWRADQIAGRPLQALLQPRLHSQGLSPADPRDAVRRP